MNIDHLRYPVGKFAHVPDSVSPDRIKLWIQEIKDLPTLMHDELKGLTPSDFSKTYRPEGWNITQLVHHLADSHMNSFIRFKLALTEDDPTIKPYLEDKWSEMPDDKILDCSYSMDILTPLHYRWGYLLDHMSESDFNKGFIHPQKNKRVTLLETLD